MSRGATLSNLKGKIDTLFDDYYDSILAVHRCKLLVGAKILAQTFNKVLRRKFGWSDSKHCKRQTFYQNGLQTVHNTT